VETKENKSEFVFKRALRVPMCGVLGLSKGLKFKLQTLTSEDKDLVFIHITLQHQRGIFYASKQDGKDAVASARVTITLVAGVSARAARG